MRKEAEMEYLKKKAVNLLSVKSLVTLILTGVFTYLAVKDRIGQEFMLIYTTVIAFYFGTQTKKGLDGTNGG